MPCPTTTIRLVSWFAAFAAMATCGCAWLPFGEARREEMSQRLSEEARISEEQGNLQEAAQSLRQATKVDPADVAARLNLARLHREAGRTNDAIVALREVVALTPDDAKAWAELGELELRVGSEVAANESLEQALKYNPHMISALMLKAELEERRRYDDLALELYHRALALDSQNGEAMLRIARIHLRRNEPMQAALLLRGLCQCRGATDQNIADARWLLGLAYGQQQRWDDATASLKIALELTPAASASDLYYLAYAQYRSGETFEAAQTAQRVQALDPTFAPARLLLQATHLTTAKISNGITLTGSLSGDSPVVPAPPGWEPAAANRYRE